MALTIKDQQDPHDDREHGRKLTDGSTATVISREEREAFNQKLTDAWEMAKSFWGEEQAQSMFVTAFSSSDPLGYLSDRLPSTGKADPDGSED